MIGSLAKWVVAVALGGLTSAALASAPPTDRADPAIVAHERRSAPVPVQTNDARPIEVAPASTVAVSATIIPGAIIVEGAIALAPDTFAGTIEPYLGRALAPEDLQRLASDVANVARSRGYGLATAWIPAQRVSDGILRVRLEEGRIDAIETSGEAAAVAKRYLAALATGRPVTTAALERQLLLVGDLAGVSAGKARLERRADGNVLVVQTSFEHAKAYASLDNWGTSEVGPAEADVTVDFNGVLAGADSLRVEGYVTPTQPREFGLLSSRYALPVGHQGTGLSIGGYYAYSYPGGVLSELDFRSRSLQGQIELGRAVVRSRARSLWAYLRVELIDSREWLDDLRIRRDRIATIEATAYGVARFDGGYVRGRLNLVQGIDAFGATDARDRSASRADADGVFSKETYWIEAVKAIGGHFSVAAASQGQIASGPLLSAEELGLGGRTFLRGYDYREFSGDQGIAGSLELRFDLSHLPKPFREGQLYGYADAGSVGNLGPVGGGGSLTSAGGGVRVRAGPVSGSIELGIPLVRGFARRHKDPRLSITFSTDF